MTYTSPLRDPEREKFNVHLGKDEMNIAEFPIAKLGRNDKRQSIEYHGRIVDKAGQMLEQTWIVSGGAKFGLPTEFAERVLVALISITAEQDFGHRKVPFTIYRVLQILGLDTGQRNYGAVKRSLKQLVGVTIYSEGAYFDKETKQRITTERAFHLIEDVWLKSWEGRTVEETNSTGYIIWGDRLWRNFKAGYIKHLDIEFYYSLQNALARRLYRFLDKRMHYQDNYQIDIFDLAARLGMKRYPFPSKVKRKLQPGIDELLARNWLQSAETVKYGKFTRMKFVRTGTSHSERASSEEASQTPSDVWRDAELIEAEDAPNDRVEPLYARYGTSEDLQQAWSAVLDELHWSLPASSYHLIAESALVDVKVKVDGAEALIAIEARYQDWIERQLRRKMLALLNDHLDQDIHTLAFLALP